MTGLLTGRLALITGAGRGLGAALAQGLARAGALLVLADIDAAALAETAAGLPGSPETVVLDVTDRTAVAACAAALMARHGGLDLLVNNAGVAGRAVFGAAGAEAVWDRIMAVNLTGAFNVAQAFVPALAARRGSVVHLGSVAGCVAGGSTAGYGASKAAIHALTRAMARDLAPQGIRVNAVAPGLMATEMGQAQLDRPGGADWFMDRAPMGRIGRPEELVGPVVFLASEMASFVTGAVLPVDGGFLAA